VKTRLRSKALLKKLSFLLATHNRMRLRTRFAFGLLIFLISFSVRSLHAVDLAPAMYTNEQPLNSLTHTYDLRANGIIAGEGLLGPYNQSPPHTFWLARAPGYSVLLSIVYATLGRDFFKVQLVQNAVNSLTSVLLFLIGGELLSWRVGVVAGTLTALSHNLSHTSNLILPDALSALPVVAAFYLLALAGFRRITARVYWGCAAGVLIGISSWLRSQIMLLGPFLVVMLTIVSIRRWTLRHTTLMAAASLLMLTPVTIRNYEVYGEFVPINIGVGEVLWVGIGEAGGDKYGAASTDAQVAEQEAALYNNPGYRQSWSYPDGIRRDRDRIKRSIAIIVRHPVWFTGVVFKRMGRMLRYARHGPLINLDGISATSPANADGAALKPAWPGWEDMPVNRSSLAIGESMSRARVLVRVLQLMVKESVPVFILIGAAIMFWASWRRALLMAAVPLYYLLFQSPLHTESRYTAPMQYFLFLFAAVAWVVMGASLWSLFKRIPVARPKGRQATSR
jgi:Dolichyl-phosphate-mannose-protein mannosyltransferase